MGLRRALHGYRWKVSRTVRVQCCDSVSLLQTITRAADSMRRMDTKHVPTKRLLEVAASKNVPFTPAEYDHLQRCATCFNECAAFIKALPSDVPKLWHPNRPGHLR